MAETKDKTLAITAEEIENLLRLAIEINKVLNNEESKELNLLAQSLYNTIVGPSIHAELRLPLFEIQRRLVTTLSGFQTVNDLVMNQINEIKTILGMESTTEHF